MVDAVEPDQAYQDQVDGDDVVQQPRKDKDQNAGEAGDERPYVSDGDNHFQISQGDEGGRASNGHAAFMHGR
jgi:hypothetical protein